MLLIIIIIVLLLAAWLTHRSQKSRQEAVANLPGPSPMPVLGDFPLVFKLNGKNLLSLAYIMLHKYGKVQRIWFFNRLIIVSFDPEMNEQFLSSTEHIRKHQVYKVMSPWLGNGLLLSDGKTWHQRRKIITPAFHFAILDQFVEVFDQQSSICVERLKEQADGKSSFDVYPYICLAALDIIVETAMGTKINAQSAGNTSYAKAVHECTVIMGRRMLSLFIHNDWIFALTHPLLKLRQKKHLKTLHTFAMTVIKQRRSALEAKQKQAEVSSQTEDLDVGLKRRTALLDVLLQTNIEGRPLTNEEILEEVNTFMFGGHDTGTMTMSFALFLLSRHPQVQAKLLAEVLQVLGTDRERPIVTRELTELKYMECVIKETLRKYPLAPIIARKLQTDFKYTHSKLGDGVIPAGSEFIVAACGMMFDSDNFPQPELFRPERHENGGRIPAFAMLPFSAGPRNCIGQKFAMLEMKMILAKIVREFELLPLGEEVKPVVNVVLSSSNGFQLGMRRRIL